MAAENPNAIPLINGDHAMDSDGGIGGNVTAVPPKKTKKVYTPFPPPQRPSKLDLQMASGEYFLKPKEREVIERKKREERQQAKAEEKRVTREEAFIPPPESVEMSVTDKKKKKRKREQE